MANVLAVRDEYRAQTWAMLIRECQSSGLSNREFCRQRGVSEKSFYYWLRKLREQAAAAMPDLVPLDPVAVETGMLQIRFKGAEISVPESVCIRRTVKSSRPAELSSGSAENEQWDRPD